MPKNNNKDFGKVALAVHKKLRGKIALAPKARLKTKDDWATLYTPGVGAVALHIAKNPKDAKMMTAKGNAVAVISDGSAVLGLGNIGPLGALPVMEGKAVIFKEMANIDAYPIVLATQDPDEIIETVVRIAPTFGGINLEDIKAPQCFYIEDEIKKRLDIPVMHDDQHGTAIVVLAGLINAVKVTRRSFKGLKIVVNGAGAAGVAITKLITLYEPGVQVTLVDSVGIISNKRVDLAPYKTELLKKKIISGKAEGGLAEALIDTDVFIGVSKPGTLIEPLIKTMSKSPIIFALANPIPEVMPDIAKKAGAAVVATGRSDFPNQVNNALVFPGIFRGALDAGVSKITDEMKLKAAKALAALVKKPSAENIIPSILDKKVMPAIARAVK